MAQFDLYPNNDKNSRSIYPYFIDIQSDFLDTLNTRLVIPLTPVTRLNKAAPEHLCPTIHTDEGHFVILTPQMTSIPVKLLKEPVNNLATFRTEIIAAIDFLITGI